MSEVPITPDKMFSNWVDNGETTPRMLCIALYKDEIPKRGEIKVEFKENIEKHPGYRLWIDTLLRCYDSGHPDYRNNSFKMTIPLIWVKSFTQFCKDLEITSDMI